MTDLDKIKDRIRAMLARTTENGCTEAEAMMAAEKADQLLAQYALTMDEVGLRQEGTLKTSVNTGFLNRTPLEFCMGSVGDFCDCKSWITKGRGNRSINFFGLDHDAEMARFLILVAQQAMKSGSITYAATHRASGSRKRLDTKSFQYGMIERISDRLDALRSERLAASVVRSSNTALMVIKDQIVEHAFAQQNLKLKSFAVKFHPTMDAYRAGQDAAEKVNLSRPIAA